MNQMPPMKEKLLTYKGKPLVRCGKTLYYGYNYDPFLILIQIASTKQVGDLEVADKCIIQLINTDPDCRPRDRIVKKSDKKGLSAAMDIASIWLERALAPSAAQN